MDIRDIDLKEMEKEIVAMGEPLHRTRQIFLWLNRKGVFSFEEMTDLPKELIKRLAQKFSINKLVCAKHLKSKDKTEKFLWSLSDSEKIETVLMRDKKRLTLCLSTEVGCKYKCPFCASGTKNFVRNLKVSEIINQIICVQKLCKCRVTNIVFMGMGEPLDNYDNLAKSILIINHPMGIGIGARKITVSTCGIVPGIRKMKDMGIQIELAVSLHSVSEEVRDILVPANRRYPLKVLLGACKEYYEETGRTITFEYTLIKGINDSVQDAENLVETARPIRAKVNLIILNQFPGLTYSASNNKTTIFFKEYLSKKGITVIIRKSRGKDILAACGQLSGFAG